MKKRVTIFFTSGIAALLLAVAAPAAGAVPLHGTEEIVLQSSASYDGRRGTPNPFEVELAARVTAPSGVRSTVPGFFDGDGEGGLAGRVFKIRVYVAEAGVWTWEVESSDPGLDRASGRFTVEGRLPGFFGRGPIVVSAARPRTFRQRDGGPVFLAGKFLDVAAPDPLKFSHTMFSEELGERDREALLRRHVDLGLNKINVYLANRGDYQGVSTTPWLGTAESNDKTRFDLGRWRIYERWVERMRDSGVVAHLWFFADDSGFGDLPDADRRRLIRYGMARLSGFVNTMFTLTLEWQEGWSRDEVEAHGRFLQENNPWARLVSAHGTTGDFAFPHASWVDYLQIQAGNDASHRQVHAMGLANRTLAARPLIQEEHGLGEESTANRQNAWAAFLAGAAGVGTGHDLAHLAKLAASIRFERMEPAGGLVLAGGAYALAERGRAYVFYLFAGGTVRVNLRGARGPLVVEWYDPRTGEFRQGPRIQGGRVFTLEAPPGGDWALYIHK
jgi:hypothetical protein